MPTRESWEPVRRARRHRPGRYSAPGRRTGCSRWCGRSPGGRSWRPAGAAPCRSRSQSCSRRSRGCPSCASPFRGSARRSARRRRGSPSARRRTCAATARAPPSARPSWRLRRWAACASRARARRAPPVPRSPASQTAPFRPGRARGVLVLEPRTLPTDGVAGGAGQKAGLAPSQLTFVVAPTASLAGGVQIVARILETGLHKMDTLGFDVNKIVSGIGTAPLPPVAKNDLRAIGRTNDCILYGGQARYTVQADDAELAELVPKIPASASKDYGTPFYDIFKRYDSDFYKIDPLLFSPAEVWLTSVQSGKTYHAGHVNPEVLRASLLES